MQDLLSFYQKQVEKYKDELLKVKQRLSISSTIRLAIFVLTALAIYLLFGNKINEIEIRVLKRDLDKLTEGNEFKNPLHHYSQDIDLFGRGSFYQFSNRTVLEQGSARLA